MHFLRKNLNHSVHIRIIVNTLSFHFYNIAWVLKAASLGTDAAGIKLYRLTNSVNKGNLAEFFCQNSANSSELL